MNATPRRIIGGVAGGFVGAILWIVYRLCTASGIHISGTADFFLIPLPGLVLGVIFGALFPKPFVWAAEKILDLIP